jgi:Fe2+ or Zn2+ uptake regulation protein
MQVDNKLVRTKNVAKLHAHFKCKYCDANYDVHLEEPDIPKFRGNSDLTHEETRIYFLGSCEKCVENLK